MDPRCFFGIGCKIDLTSGVSKPSFDSNYAIPKLFFRMDADSIGIIGTARYFFFFWIPLLGFPSYFMMFIVSFAREKKIIELAPIVCFTRSWIFLENGY